MQWSWRHVVRYMWGLCVDAGMRPVDARCWRCVSSAKLWIGCLHGMSWSGLMTSCQSHTNVRRRRRRRGWVMHWLMKRYVEWDGWMNDAFIDWWSSTLSETDEWVTHWLMERYVEWDGWMNDAFIDWWSGTLSETDEWVTHWMMERYIESDWWV